MAVRSVLVDDVTGDVIASGRGGTVTFSVDDCEYEIDLTSANIGKLHLAFAPFVAAARSLSSSAPQRRVIAVPAGAGRKSPEMLAAIRHWARRNGHKIPPAGRIPRDVQAAFDAAH